MTRTLKKGAGLLNSFSAVTIMSVLRASSLLFLTFFGAQAALGFPDWCVVPAALHVLQNETCSSMKNYSSDKVEIFAMRGEQEDKQVLLDLRSLPAQNNLTSAFTITFGELKLVNTSDSVPHATIDAASFSWWQVGYVYCKHTTRYADSGGGWRPDPLLVDNQYKKDDGTTSQGILLESGVTQPIWISVRVPYGIPAGKYTGNLQLTIRLSEGNILIQNVSIELTVWNIDLPSQKDAKFPAIFSFNPGSLDDIYGKEEAEEMKWKYYDLYLDQRMGGNNLYTGVPANITVASYLADKGVRWLSLMDIYGVASSGDTDIADIQPQLNISGGSDFKVEGNCLIFTDELVQKAIDLLTPVVEEYEKRNLLDSMFVYGFDEAPQTCESSVRKIYTALKQKWPKLRTVAVLNWLPSLDLPLDVWVLQYETFNEANALKWTATGKEQWWYHCIEPSGVSYLNTFIERPLMEARLLFWLAASYQVGGWLYYSDFMWKRYPTSNKPMNKISDTARTDFDPANYIWLPNTAIFANGDGNFVYPGVNGPIQTARLRNLRDGFEDIELFRMVDKDKVKQIVSSSVTSATSFVLNPLALDKGRREAALVLSNN